MIHTLENKELRIRINDLGAELSEIYDKTNEALTYLFGA